MKARIHHGLDIRPLLREGDVLLQGPRASQLRADLPKAIGWLEGAASEPKPPLREQALRTLGLLIDMRDQRELLALSPKGHSALARLDEAFLDVLNRLPRWPR